MDSESCVPKSYKLNNGYEMPSVGFGTSGIMEKDAIIRAIMDAGYRLIDTATLYGNEEVIGQALAECF
jgi:diketogulonate reductase-like aldo/keto reductase